MSQDGGTMTAPKAWVEEVLGFWFTQLSEEDWYSADPSIDEDIRRRFANLHATLHQRHASSPDTARLADDPRELFASVIVLDQFSRHLFRGDPRAFQSDAAARRLASAAIDAGLDQGFPARQRLFFYLPFQHSEILADQARSVALTAALGNAEWDLHARQHQALIDRFGRFPHRNAVLGRASTAEELQALQEDGNAF